MSKNDEKNAEQANMKDRIPAEMKESAQKIWLAGLGALSAAEQEGSKLFKTLVEKGENFESRGKVAFGDAKEDVTEAVHDARSKAESTWDKVEERLDDVVSGALKRFGVPSREEISTLTQRVEELTRVVESLKPAAKPAATPAKKPTTRSSKTGSATH